LLTKKIVLALPAVFLALSLDRLSPDVPPPSRSVVSGWSEAAPLLPVRNVGRFGRPGDPLNLVFVGSPAAVRAALTEAGWTEIPTATRSALLSGSLPMNDYRLRGRRQDMNWAIQVRPLSARHHFRMWRTGFVDPQGRDLWWGSGNYDQAIRWSDLSHVPDPDGPAERDFIAAGLAGSPRLESSRLVTAPGVPREGANDKGYPFRSDGRAALIVLKASKIN
jgi:hypothetical protein